MGDPFNYSWRSPPLTLDSCVQMLDNMHVPGNAMVPLPPALANLPHHHHCHHLRAGMDIQYCSNLIELQKNNLGMFWKQQILEMKHMQEIRQHPLPLARIKRIMKADGEVKMISAETPMLFSKACELFILDLTLRSWIHANEGKRRTIQRIDVASAICHGEILNFLYDLVPISEFKYGFVHGEVMARKLGGRVGFSPPSPQPNRVKHHIPPETPGGGPPSTHG
ncbi:Nuclear transcription factor Y subunit C-1 [Acorus gramineus]|uniref:Nuclear transcription factor Y subunit C-1 n=1 Tax=Acorus gramineus TaxID=55184 RepID=A0AAV9BTB6_ACOGR|nr:Nuclear transcription factor Y subunit C-1 [Acorus gramineus]